MNRFLIILAIFMGFFLFSSCEDTIKSKAQKLIKILKEGGFKERQKAIKGLTEIGAKILPELHRCEQSENLNASMNCKLIIAEVHKKRREAICKNIVARLKESMSFDNGEKFPSVRLSDMRKYGEWRKKFEECTFFNVGYEESFNELNKFRNFILAGSFPEDSKKKTDAVIQGIAKDLKADKNNNGLPDEWEKHYDQTDPNADPDGDGIKNKDEAKKGTNPYKKNK